MPESLQADLVGHDAPRTRSLGALWLLEELGVRYRLACFGVATGYHKSPRTSRST
jgi:hypothetical protein